MNGIKHINVRTFREALSDQLLGLEDFEVVGLGHVHGTAKGMESPFVFYLKNTDGLERTIYIPSLEE